MTNKVKKIIVASVMLGILLLSLFCNSLYKKNVENEATIDSLSLTISKYQKVEYAYQKLVTEKQMDIDLCNAEQAKTQSQLSEWKLKYYESKLTQNDCQKQVDFALARSVHPDSVGAILSRKVRK